MSWEMWLEVGLNLIPGTHIFIVFLIFPPNPDSYTNMCNQPKAAGMSLLPTKAPHYECHRRHTDWFCRVSCSVMVSVSFVVLVFSFFRIFLFRIFCSQMNSFCGYNVIDRHCYSPMFQSIG